MLLPSTRNVSFALQLTATVFWLSVFTLTCNAQGNFVSGSTGADGPFNPTQSQTVPLPESGIFNFTTVNIPSNVTIRFGRNSRNTPVTILATGNVTIAGLIDISGLNGGNVLGGAGGPGGFNGGNGGFVVSSNVTTPGVNGDGPGGGGGGGSATSNSAGNAGGGGFGTPGLAGEYTQTQIGQGFTLANGAGGPKYGLPTLLPLIGGSGGGGDLGRGLPGGGGGGGGGAILIASSGTINFSSNPSLIFANGGHGFARNFGSGGGSGGAVRLIANVITGIVRIDAGGGLGLVGGNGGGGLVRLEAFNMTNLNLTIGGNPRVFKSTPTIAVPSNLPTIRIVSVAGIVSPNNPNGSLQREPDIVLPTNQANPVSVALSASNIPLGTTLQVTLTPENGASTAVQSTALTGTLASSTATASITIPDGISVIQASGIIDVSALGLVVNGEQVKSIEVNAVFGGKQTITYITASNKRIKVDQ